MLTKPFLAKCDNRSIMPKSNSVTGAPEEWFDNAILEPLGYTGFSFDFFVDWSKSPSTITPMAWVKRLLSKALDEYSDDELITLLEASENAAYLKKFAEYCEKQGLTLQYLLFRDIDWSKNPEPIGVITITNTPTGVSYAVERITLSDLQDRIRSYSGGAVRIGSKGLMYGTTTLECYLSQTDSLYPGDADLVIVDKDLNNIALLEFKKHNLDTPITDQKLSNYYPYPDGRKYDRLSILQSYLSPSPKLITLYYPTKTNEIAIVEEIVGNVGKLSVGKRGKIELPKAGQKETYTTFVSPILRYVTT